MSNKALMIAIAILVIATAVMLGAQALDPSKQYYSIEAEQASLSSPMAVYPDNTASSGKYVSSSSDSNGAVSFTFSASQDADYLVWSRVYGPDSGSDSFYVSVDGGSEDVFDITDNGFGLWSWMRLQGRDAGSPRVLYLKAGTHTIKFRSREHYARLDKIIITNDMNYVPSSDAVSAPKALPLAVYPLTETSGSQVYEKNGNAAPGTLSGGATLTGSGVAFDGVSARLALPAFNFPQGSFTVELWAKRSGTYSGGNTGKDATLIGSSGYYDGWRIVHRDPVTSDGTIVVQKGGADNIASGTGNAICRLDSSSSVSLSDWTHLAAVWDGSRIYLYINGVLDSSAECKTTYVSSQSDSTAIGRDYYGVGTFNGLVRDIRIYNAALSQSDVVNDKNQPSTGAITPVSNNTVSNNTGSTNSSGSNPQGNTTLPVNTTVANSSTSSGTAYYNVEKIPATCIGGSITSDKFDGGRHIKCNSATAVLSVDAWDKPGIYNAKYFEMYKQFQDGPGLKICLLSTCISDNGFARSPNYPIMSASAPINVTINQTTNSTGNKTTPINQTNSTNQTTSTNQTASGPAGQSTPLPPLPSGAKRYYVAANGNDNNDGLSQSSPWQSLDKVSNMYFNAGDQILFRRGDVFVGKLKISSSGSSDKKIYYASYGSGNKPVITTSQSVNGWSKYKDNIYVATINRNVGLVSVDGVMLNPAHYPASGYLTIDSMDGSHGIVDNDLSVNDLSGATIYWRPWTGDTYSTNIVSYNNPEITIGSYDDGNSMIVPKSGWGYYLVGKLWMLDSGAGWMYDGSRLYVRLPNGDSPANHLIEATTPYPSGQNNNAVNADNLHDFVLQDLEVRNAIEYGIRFYGVSNAQLKNCLVRSIGKHGIDVENSNYITIDSSTVDGTVKNGIYMEGTQGNKVTNNDVRNSGTAGLEGSRGQGIYFFYGSHGNLVENNTVINTSFAGIFYGGHDNTIRHNYVGNYCLTLNDCGGIYTWGKSSSNPSGPNNLLDSNLVVNGIGDYAGTTDRDHMARGIYIDDMSYGTTIRNNFVVDAADYGIMIHNAHDCPVSNNLVYGTNGNPITFYRDDNDAQTGEVTRNPASNNIFFATYKSSSDNMANVYLTQMPDYPATFGPFDNNYFGDMYSTKQIRDQSWGVYNDLYTVSEYNAHYGNNLFTGSSFLSSYYSRNKFTDPAIDSTVIYNTDRATRTFSLGKAYCDLYGKKVSGSVTVPSFGAVILVRGDAGCV